MIDLNEVTVLQTLIYVSIIAVYGTGTYIVFVLHGKRWFFNHIPEKVRKEPFYKVACDEIARNIHRLAQFAGCMVMILVFAFWIGPSVIEPGELGAALFGLPGWLFFYLSLKTLREIEHLRDALPE